MDESEKDVKSALLCKFTVSYASKDVQTLISNLRKTQTVLTTQHAAVDASTCDGLSMCIQLDPGDCSERAELNQHFQRQSLEKPP